MCVCVYVYEREEGKGVEEGKIIRMCCMTKETTFNKRNEKENIMICLKKENKRPYVSNFK